MGLGIPTEESESCPWDSVADSAGDGSEQGDQTGLRKSYERESQQHRSPTQGRLRGHLHGTKHEQKGDRLKHHHFQLGSSHAEALRRARVEDKEPQGNEEKTEDEKVYER